MHAKDVGDVYKETMNNHMMFYSDYDRIARIPPPDVPSVNGTCIYCITCLKSVSLEIVSHFAIGMISSNNALNFFVEKALNLSVWSGSNPPFSWL